MGKRKKGIDESFLIYKDDELLDVESQSNFINYLLSIIPPDMFNFYFFDGESIADFFWEVAAVRILRTLFETVWAGYVIPYGGKF